MSGGSGILRFLPGGLLTQIRVLPYRPVRAFGTLPSLLEACPFCKSADPGCLSSSLSDELVCAFGALPSLLEVGRLCKSADPRRPPSLQKGILTSPPIHRECSRACFRLTPHRAVSRRAICSTRLAVGKGT